MNPIDQLTKLTYVAVASVALNFLCILAILWMRKRTGNGTRQLKIWDGRSFTPIPLKAGQKQYVWSRPDKTKVAFELRDDWGTPEGRRGFIWIANGMDGNFLKWRSTERRWVAVPQEQRNGELQALGLPAVEKETPDGTLMKVAFDHERVFPDGNWHAGVIEDTRERKWFAEGLAKVAESGTGRKFILIALAVVALILLGPKLGLFGK